MARFFTRHTAFHVVIAGTLFFLLLSITLNGWWLLPTALFAALTLRGILDLKQTSRTIRRNYPVIGNLRFFFEFIRPEIRQYFVESDTQPLPFSRVDRSLVYQRAKRENDKVQIGRASCRERG